MTSRWVVPGFGLALGVVLAVAFTIGQSLGAGVAVFGVMVAYVGLLVLGRRFEAVAVLGGDATDERRRAIDREASLVSGYVLLAVVLGAFVWEVAQGHDGRPWSLLGAVAGLTYLGAVVVLRRRR